MNNPIFIFASGQRCGSTLLQRFLNSHEDILIWGEQHGIINNLLNLQNKLLKWENTHHEHRKTYLEKGYDNFIPNMVPTDQEIKNASKDYLLSLFAKPSITLDKKIWGFKEVRYDYELATFILSLFPDAKIIWLSRNIVDCFISLKHWENSETSPWSRQWTEIFINSWERINDSFLSHLSLLNKENYLHIKYEDLVTNNKETSKIICDFIGIPYLQFNNDVFSKKLHSGGNNGALERKKITREDLTKEEWDLLLTPKIIDISSLLNYDLEL